MICGLYHPPKPRYIEDNLISYLTDVSDLFLDGSLDGTVLIGGDLNNLNLDKLSALSGLTALIDFPKCYPFDAQIKSGHRDVIVPAGAKRKPMRFKYTMHD